MVVESVGGDFFGGRLLVLADLFGGRKKEESSQARLRQACIRLVSTAGDPYVRLVPVPASPKQSVGPEPNCSTPNLI